MDSLVAQNRHASSALGTCRAKDKLDSTEHDSDTTAYPSPPITAYTILHNYPSLARVLGTTAA